MQEWIHVVTATKAPVPRGTSGSPFEFYEEGFDPNVGTPFGPDKESMFLAVLRPEPPEVNPVLLQVVRQTTLGANGLPYAGAYTAPTWTVGWEPLPQDLAISKEVKTGQLYQSRDLHVAAGYEVNGGTFTFPLTEDFHKLLLDRYNWLNLAVAQLAVPSNTKITFSDLSSKEVRVGLDTLKTHCIQFGIEYLGMNEKVVKARESITTAETPGQVDAVTWAF